MCAPNPGFQVFLSVFFGLILNIRVTSGQSIQLTGYPVSAIPDSLLVDANAVIRDEVLEYTYISSENNVLRYHKVVTVLNKNGDDQAAFRQSYDKYSRISSFHAQIWDREGHLVRKIKPSEIKDYSGSAGYALFDDVRYQSFEPLMSVYPYTVELEFEMQLSGSMSFPRWMAFEDYNVSIERTVFRVVVPRDYTLRYREFNLTNPGQLEYDAKQKTYSWEALNLVAFDHEPFAEPLINYIKAVYTAPSGFSYGGYAGKMDTWKDFAAWIEVLNAGRDVLPENRVQQIRELVRDLPDDRAKVEKLYAYLQGKTRYFNIALGIGGLQPVEAATVDEVGYGDCKGLSNYMKALLKAAGIESYYTLVASGGNFPRIIADFPSNQFDHAMLCVPLANDTIWLECTSQIIPFGFLGDFTSDRHVLLVKEEDGELVRTPAYVLEENVQVTRAKVVIDQDGNGIAEIDRSFGGLQFDDAMVILHSTVEDQKSWLYSYINLPNYQLTGFQFQSGPAGKPESVLHYTLKLDKYGASSGKRLFIQANLTNRSSYIPPKVKQRFRNIVQTVPFVDTDSVTYTLPDGMDFEYIPEPREILTPFGEYRASYSSSGNKLTYVRQVRMFKGNYPGDHYTAFMKFHKDISTADKEQLILIRKEI